MIVDVPKLLEYLGIDAKRQGNEMWAKCPYPGHKKDTKPSWSIAVGGERNGLNCCFGCGASGNAIELVMEVIGLSSYGVAIDWMKEEGLIADSPNLVSIGVTLKLKTKELAEIEVPNGLLHDPNKWPSPAKKYAESRGIGSLQLYRWKIACAVDGELAGRLWIPTYNINERLLDWTARTWCSDDLKHKCPKGGGLPGAIFGERYWPRRYSERLNSRLVICEGAFDAMACERAGAQFVAALAGAAKIDSWRIMKLAAWKEIVLALDPDDAGRRAANTIATMLARVPRVGNISKIELPNGFDCDALWKQDPDHLIGLLHERKRQ